MRIFGNERVLDCTDENRPCGTMEQAWNQLNDYGDSNGIIEIGEGEYDFYDSLYLENQQVIIRGVAGNTTVRFMQYFDKLMGCQWYNCWLQIENVIIASEWNDTRTYKQIYMENGGTLLMDTVHFDGNNYNTENEEESFWKFSDDVTAKFTNCIFTENDVSYTIINGANVQFIDSKFVNNQITNTNLREIQGMFDVYDNGSVSFINCSFENNTQSNRYTFTYQTGAHLTFINIHFTRITGSGKLIFSKYPLWPYQPSSIRSTVNVEGCVFEYFGAGISAIFGIGGGLGDSDVDITIDNSVFRYNVHQYDYKIYNTPISEMNQLIIRNTHFSFGAQYWSILCDYTNVFIEDSKWYSSSYYNPEPAYNADVGVFHIANGHFSDSHVILNNVTLKQISGRGLVADDVTTGHHQSYIIRNSHFNDIMPVQYRWYQAACIEVAESQNIIIQNTRFEKCKGMTQEIGVVNSSTISESNVVSGAIYANKPGNLSVFEGLEFVDNFGNNTADLYLITEHQIDINGSWDISGSLSYGDAASIYLYYESPDDWNLELNDWSMTNTNTTYQSRCAMYVDGINIQIVNMFASANALIVMYYGDSSDGNSVVTADNASPVNNKPFGEISLLSNVSCNHDVFAMMVISLHAAVLQIKDAFALYSSVHSLVNINVLPIQFDELSITNPSQTMVQSIVGSHIMVDPFIISSLVTKYPA